MSVVIRSATRDEVAKILDIFNEVIMNTTAVYSYDPHTLEMRLAWFDERMSKSLPVIVAVDDLTQEVAGFASYGPFRPSPCYKFTIENTVHIHKDYRGKGIATLLLKALIDIAKEQKYHKMVAAIDSSNDVSIHLHKKFGFAESGRLTQVGYKFDRWLDLVLYDLLLE